MPRAHSWQGRIGEITQALEATASDKLARRDIELLFGIQRRAALRLMQAVGPSEKGGEWRVDRDVLMRWVRDLAGMLFEEGAQTERIQHLLREAAVQKQKLKNELRKLGAPDPASWTVPAEAFSAQVRLLPPEIVVTSGMVSVAFPPEDPAEGAKLLHQLSLAMLADWQGFCFRTGGRADPGSQDRIDELLEALEQAKLQGLD